MTSNPRVSADFNVLTIGGRLVDTPQAKNTASGTAMAVGSIAYNERRQVSGVWQTKVWYLNFAAFGKQAETLMKQGQRGYWVVLTGALRPDSWVNKSGVTVNSVSMVAEGVYFPTYNNNAPEYQQPTIGYEASHPDPTDDEIPF